MEGCTCKKCIESCYRSPGWFGSIKEIEGAAKIMGLSVKKFCKEYLIQEWLAGDDKDNISIPAPRKNFNKSKKNNPIIEDKYLKNEFKRNGKGFVIASWGHNLITGFACIFLDDNERCMIHKSKPLECRESFGCKYTTVNLREKAFRYWKNHQDFIRKME